MSMETGVKDRESIDKKYRWAIEEIYADLEAFEKDFAFVKEQKEKLKDFKGKLSQGQQLYNYLKQEEKVYRVLDKLYVYASLKRDENTMIAENQTLQQRADVLSSETNAIISYFVPEVLEIGEERIKEEINEVPELKLYEFYLMNILDEKPHTLPKEQEELLSKLDSAFGVPENTWNMLLSADLKFPCITTKNGEKIQISDSNFTAYLKSKDRDLRFKAFKAAFGAFKDYKNTFASLVLSSIKNFGVKAKMRNYENALEYALKPDHIPVKVHEITLDTIHKNLPILHKYIALKKKVLKVDELHMYDMYAPLVDKVEDNIPYEEGVELILKGLAPLGKEYLDIFKSGIENRWVDVYENKGKKGGAYSWGTYDTKAYVHVNYSNHYSDVSMLAHEMGHSIHSYYSNHNQPYIYSFHSGFCAEVASTTNESLLAKYLIDVEEDKNKKMFYIAAQLEQMRIVVFRAALFDEFEHRINLELEKGNILSADDICKIYHDLNVMYYGNDIVVDDDIDMEWARVVQYFSNYYNYQYVTGFSAGNSFSKAILEGGQEAVDKYLTFLKSGNSLNSIELLKRAGVDMTTSKPLQDTLDVFAERVEMLENLLTE
ncbi:oligopeptidase F. Metallo peptidase. MEROPS family M03B [Hathewaya proteolytica DSM 3090]|uniref:Oligopeptidase F n=1 Tax=Hathewaya proteolytica DSM 3090 TaxID=1121331 RepID=A0A1M6KLJ7_9CLOT|nr:oligoendopeptidase F [Hathewaya proteolytica]SHJ59848.1 oligopeptidase F. Metallo peptidase. MEROPS family M03B [Hathewaya proteolytica DSM 3090]